jgi:myo-inositol-1(or 4)-monophosphatase
MEQAELDHAYEFAIDLALRAGQVLLDRAATIHTRTEKESAVDIVTEVDEEVEALIKGDINRKYPAHKFIGEETYSKGASREYLIDDSPTWCVDPLDGTVNYVHRFPMFCVSIALVVGGVPVVGAVYAPALQALYSACNGRGAWLNKTIPLPLSHTPVPPIPKNAPSGCLFSCEWGKSRSDKPDGHLQRKVESFTTMATERSGRGGLGGHVHGVRSLGSATLDLAYCATGALDIWWEAGCWEWDVAAGICILNEAGGLITTGRPPADPVTSPIPACKLGSRQYLAIRPAGDADGETGRQAQERTVREVWKRVRQLDYPRQKTQ